MLVSLSQRKHVLDLMEETASLGEQPVNTSLDPNHSFWSLRKSCLMIQESLSSLIGKWIILLPVELTISMQRL